MKHTKALKAIGKHYKWLVFLMCLIIFIHISVELTYNQLISLDDRIYSLVSSVTSKKATKFFRFVTRFGSGEVMFPVWLFVLILFRDKKKAALSALNIGCILSLNQILKQIFERPRPAVVRLAEASGFSFPSGHSMVSLAFYGFILYLVFKSDFTKSFKVMASVFTFGLLVLIGVSRIYLGVHYSTDVLAGFSLSLAYLILFMDIVDKIFYNKKAADSFVKQ